ncbi:hypothetical protein DL764_007537 [Monosporascus ibericus]|uniref:Uncharacterized protein n=1 Tax=Monosporascus ibericus TaxID=155417 RepID=A0A4Q4T2W4_9PEZI|nr:hypothetical protein DL764_007537 [Monosporascus ibericus]
MEVYSLLVADVAALEQCPVRFFESLVICCYGIPREWPANGMGNDDVVAAINGQHGIVRWPTPAVRLDVHGSLVRREGTPPKRPLDTIAESRYGSRHAIQSTTSMCVLMGLLSANLVRSIFVIWSSERSGYGYAVSKAPGSIPAVASLLADTKIRCSMSEEYQWIAGERVGAHLDGGKICLG